MTRTVAISPAGRAARALARSGLSVLRIPEDLEALSKLGFPESGADGVAALAKLGLIRPVSRGLYEVRDQSGTTRSSFELLLAARFAGAPHLATGWWALAQRGLTNQDVREVTILGLTNRRTVMISGRRARAVRVDPNEIWGGEARGSGLVLARPERALCDCAGRRSTRVPATRIVEALDTFLGSEARGSARLVAAVRRYGMPAAARRLGYLVELVAGPDAAEPFRQLMGRSHKADALDLGDTDAPIITKWRLRSRLSADELLEHRRVL